MHISVQKIHPDAVIPEYATPGAAGMDLVSVEHVVIPPNSWVRISIGLAFAIPNGYEMQIRSRSGIAYRDGLIVHQGIGTIDSDYRGEVFIVLRNVGMSSRAVKKGQRIAQAVIAPVCKVSLDVVDDLGNTSRGNGGFGSTGR